LTGSERWQGLRTVARDDGVCCAWIQYVLLTDAWCLREIDDESFESSESKWKYPRKHESYQLYEFVNNHKLLLERDCKWWFEQDLLEHVSMACRCSRRCRGISYCALTDSLSESWTIAMLRPVYLLRRSDDNPCSKSLAKEGPLISERPDVNYACKDKRRRLKRHEKAIGHRDGGHPTTRMLHWCCRPHEAERHPVREALTDMYGRAILDPLFKSPLIV
ncbi:hypothetical protein KCU61_g135, partial [Aureobasidium melanogenum]